MIVDNFGSGSVTFGDVINGPVEAVKGQKFVTLA
jgi:hypothetical protein